MKQARGFTLVEMLLYSSAVGMMFFGIFTVLTATFDTQQRQRIRVEVEQQGIYIMDHIIHTLKDGISVTAPSLGTSGTTLTFTSNDAPNSPVSYTLTGDDLFVSYNGGGQNILNNDQVVISNVTFSNLSSSGYPDIVQIVFTLTNATPPPGEIAINYAREFSTSVTLNP